MRIVLLDTNMIKGDSLKLCDAGLVKSCMARVKATVPVNPLPPSQGAGTDGSHPFSMALPSIGSKDSTIVRFWVQMNVII